MTRGDQVISPSAHPLQATKQNGHWEPSGSRSNTEISFTVLRLRQRYDRRNSANLKGITGVEYFSL